MHFLSLLVQDCLLLLFAQKKGAKKRAADFDVAAILSWRCEFELT